MGVFTDNSKLTDNQKSTTDFNLISSHWLELCTSAISTEIQNLNFTSLKDYEPLERLFHFLPRSDRRNNGVVRSRLLQRYRHCEYGGWWFGGVDLETLEDSNWGCFKPNSPRFDHSKGKPIKYEHPPKTKSRVFAPKLGVESIRKICDQWGVVSDSLNMGNRFYSDLVHLTKIPLVITEGAKKACSLSSAGFVGLGLSGQFNGIITVGNQHELIKELKPYVENRLIYLAFDKDKTPKAIKQTRLAISRTAYALKRAGATVRVITWKDDFKGIDDAIFEKGEKYLSELIENAQSIDAWKIQTSVDLDPWVNCAVSKRYLGTIHTPETSQLIGVQSAKNTGKTESLAGIVEQANRQGVPVLVLSHRIQLTKHLCDRFGVDHVEQIRTSEFGGMLGYGLCIDSLHPFSKARIHDYNWSEAIVIIDEVEQVFWHMVNSSTCKRKRVAILNTLKSVLNTVVRTGGKIYLSDADLSPMSLAFVQSLLDREVETYTIKNSYNPIAGKRKLFVAKTQRELLAIAEKKVLTGEKLYIACGAQKKASKWSTQNIETLFSDRLPDAKILRIDSESIADSEHPAYKSIEHLDELVKDYDIVLASPTIETGVSIDLENHFSAVMAISSGVQTVDAVCQAVERVRADIDRYLFAPNLGQSFVGARETNPYSLIKTQEEIAQTNIQALIASDLSELDYDNFDRDFGKESLTYWARRAALVNQGMFRYREAIVEKLVSEGYILTDIEEAGETSAEIQVEISCIKDKAYSEELEEISARPDIDDKELKKLEEKHSLTVEEKQIQKKAVIQRKYQVEVNPELVKKDDKGWYGQLRLHYYLTLGREHLYEREARKMKNASTKTQKESENFAVFAPDINKDLLALKINALEKLNLKQFFDPDQQFSSADLMPWFEEVRAARHQIKAILGIWISDESTPIKTAQSLLRKLGLKLTYKGKFGSRGDRQGYYSGVSANLDGRDTIFEKWLEEDRKQRDL